MCRAVSWTFLVLLACCLVGSSVQTHDDFKYPRRHARHASSRQSDHGVQVVTPVLHNWDEEDDEASYRVQRQQPVELAAPIELTEYEWGAPSAPQRRVSELNRDGDAASRGRQQPSDRSRGRADDREEIIRCGQVDIDARGALCCGGLVYRRTPGADARCCGRIAYDGEYFACCGPPGRTVIMRRTANMPACCDEGTTQECRDVAPDRRGGYARDSTGLGSVCCRPPGGGGWRCCLRGERCCDGQPLVDVPGFRPTCCDSNTETAALCCARTYESIRVLPECCDNDRLKPICCRRPDGSTRCCPATFGYCCGQTERIVPTPYQATHVIQTTPAYPPRRPQHPSRYQPTLPPPRRQRPSSDEEYPTENPDAAMLRDRERVDQRDNPYPIEGSSYGSAVGSAGAQQTGNSSTSCCRWPSATCCRSATASRRTPACCRPLCCRVTTYSYSCCQRQRSSNSTGSDVTTDRRDAQSGQLSDTSRPQDDEAQPEDLLRHHGHPRRSHDTSGRRQAFGGGVDASSPAPTASCCSALPRRRHGGTGAHESCCRDGYLATGRQPACCGGGPADDDDDTDPDRQIGDDPVDHPQRSNWTSPAMSSSRRGRLRAGGTQRHHGKRHLDDSRSDSVADDGREATGTGRRPGKPPKDGSGCDGISSDDEDFICCAGNLRPKIGVASACCGSVAYDSFLFRCCAGDQVRMSCDVDYRPKKSLFGVLV